MKLQPVSNHIIIKVQGQESITASGIIIPDTVDQERPERGEVIAVGPGKIGRDGKREWMEVEVGQTVIFKKYAPDEVEVDGEKYLIIKSDEVMAILNQ